MNYVSKARLRLLLSVVLAMGCATASINGTLAALMVGTAEVPILQLAA